MRRSLAVTVTVVAVVGLSALLVGSCGDSGPSSSTPPTTVPQPTPTPPPTSGVGDSFNHASCPLGKGDPDATCERTRRAAAERLRGRPRPAGPAEARDLRLDARGRARHQGLSRPGQGRLHGRDRPQPARGRPVRRARPRRRAQRRSGSRTRTASPRTSTSRCSRAGTCAGARVLYRQSCTPRQLPGRARERRAADRQRLRPPLPARGHALQLQGPPHGARVLHARLDADRRTRRRVLRRRSATPTVARSARSAPRARPTAPPARTGASARRRTPAAPGPPGARQTAASAPGPRAAARTTRTPSTRSGPTSPGPTR